MLEESVVEAREARTISYFATKFDVLLGVYHDFLLPVDRDNLRRAVRVARVVYQPTVRRVRTPLTPSRGRARTPSCPSW